MEELLRNDIYLIPRTSGVGKLIYSPLRKMLFSASDAAAEAIRLYVMNGIPLPSGHEQLRDYMRIMMERQVVSPMERNVGSRNHAVILLSHRCNLACSYCYAQEARSSETMDRGVLNTVIDGLFQNMNGNLMFTFMGGGEPTLTWELLSYGIKRIRSWPYDQSRVKVGVTTNATLLNHNRIAWLKAHDTDVGISFEILPDIQDRQRGFPGGGRSSHAAVDDAIGLLAEAEIYPRLRATITPNNLHRMTEMVEYVHEHYPHLKKLHFEHATQKGLSTEDYYDPFAMEFFHAKQTAASYGIELRNSVITSVYSLRSRFCKGEYCITPSGSIVSCHRVASADDPLFEKFHYGQATLSGVELDEEKRAKVQTLAEAKPAKCERCFARWHCAGICTENRFYFGRDGLDKLCRFARDMIRRELEERAGEPVLANYTT